MNSKKKLIVALSTLCCVLVAAVVTVVAVLAATQQTLTSNVTVTYTATEIAGSVKANYATEANQTGVLHAEYAFTGADVDKESVNTEPTIELTSEDRYVEFVYEFHNDGDRAFTASVVYTDDYVPAESEGATATGVEDKNVKIVVSTTQLTSYDAVVAATESTTGTATIAANTADGETQKVYIYVAIEDVAKDANFSGAFDWTLTKV